MSKKGKKKCDYCGGYFDYLIVTEHDKLKVIIGQIQVCSVCFFRDKMLTAIGEI